MFQRARQSRVFQDVVTQIQEAILTGKLKAGDKLPSERELRQLFRTSRGTLREALRVLEQKGLIEIRIGVGGGAVVRAVNTEKISESLALLIRSQGVSLSHLAEFREVVEGMVASLAAQRASKADVQDLHEMLKQAAAYLQKGAAYWDNFIRVDKQFHLTLARVTGNPVFMYVLQTIHENIHRYYERYLPKDAEVLGENYRDLCDIATAVGEADTNKAGSLARDHVRRFNTYMENERRQVAD
jgi:GntR family transcriptional repressor for pyruvate dehydrogenase complex